MILLASASPRRAELLRRQGVAFLTAAADIDETPLPGERAGDYVLRLAEQKALEVFPLMSKKNCQLVLAADTTVTIDDLILGKPCSFEEFRDMMELLSGREHSVLSGVALIDGTQKPDSFLVTTAVRFRKISTEEIERYWRSGEPKDKAGGYAIQGLAEAFVEQLRGSYSNVVGLPIAETLQSLHSRGVASHLYHPG